MKCLWIDINASFSHCALAFPTLQAQLPDNLNRSLEWERLYGTLSTSHEELVQSFLEIDPDCVFGTLWLFNHLYVTQLVSLFKSLRPHTRIVLGGPEFLGTPAENERFLRTNPAVDFVFRGEAQEVFPHLVEALLLGDATPKVNGLCYLLPNGAAGADGQYVDGGCAVLQHFERLTPPEASPWFDWTRPFVQLETSHGCFNSCRFCVSGRGEALQLLPLKEVSQRLDHLLEKGVTQVRLLDRTFNTASHRTKELLAILKNYAGKIRFHVEVHPALLSAEVLQMLGELPDGLLHVEAGIQSLDDQVLTASGRKGNAKQSLEGLKALVGCHKFQVHCDLIAGLPYYTYSGLFADTLVLMDTGVDEIQIELLKALPGTQMRCDAPNNGLVYSPFPPYQVLKTQWISYEQLLLSMALSHVMDHWYNVSEGATRALFLYLCHRFTTFLEAFLSMHIKKDWIHLPMSRESRWLHLYQFCSRAFPEALPYISAGWVVEGFSLKKLPGLCFKKDREGFYYLDLKHESVQCRVWYDRTECRQKPIKVEIYPHI